MYKSFLIKWKSWYLPSKIGVFGVIITVISFLYMIAFDIKNVFTIIPDWNEHNAILHDYSSEGHYLKISNYLKTIQKNKYSDLIFYYQAVITLNTSGDFGGIQTERVLRKITPESKLYISAQSLRLINANRYDRANPEFIINIAKEMSESNAKNFFYYFLILNTPSEINYEQLQLLMSELESYYKKWNFEDSGSYVIVNAKDLPFNLKNKRYVSIVENLEPLYYRNTLYYLINMRLAQRANIECRTSSSQYYLDSQNIYYKNKKQINNSFSNLGFSIPIKALDGFLERTNNNCLNSCNNKICSFSFKPEDIIVSGLNKLSPGTIFYYLNIKPGDVMDKDSINNSFLNLYESKFFESVRLKKENNNLEVYVKERYDRIKTF